jgi:hypothetical protein
VGSTFRQKPSLGIPGNSANEAGDVFKPSPPMGFSGPCRQEGERTTSTQPVPVPCLQETFSSLARPLEPTPWHHGLRMRGRSQGYLRTTARSGQPEPLGECHAQVTQWPVDAKSSVAWELRLAGKAGSTQPWCAQVTHGPPPYVPGLPRTQRKDTAPNQDRATSLQFLPARLAGLPEPPARQELPQHSPGSKGLGAHCDLTAESFMSGPAT